MSEALAIDYGSDDVYSNYVNIIRNLSLDRWASQTGRTDLVLDTLNEAEASRRIKSHQSAYILLSGKGIRIEFRAYFSNSAIQQLMSPVFKKAPEDIPRELLHDSVREFCNLVAGGIKSILSDGKKLQLGLSIPLVSRAFDEVWFQEDDDVRRELWSVRGADGHIMLALSSTIIDPSVLQNISAKITSSVIDHSDNGDMELL